ncbi:TRAP transporter small permease subunit [Halomonas denitrificans]|uniref:TRAP transporter small permease subunit n=1 Tax=Halomonas TaxID=2745 RepID=UPI001C97594D|nr:MULTISPECIES: TRAP transporter small permease subunit [Halomonas]MED5295912.1 TRAP transporter small permease subunit [Pseudomonadota bacterium]MBY5927392.1 TRAP transporter small permease subunit [Halomonas sp. DP4Y7-2]MBY5929232.1 TRAP transporter small permease subunit [Halomonas sp. DP8Y7-3]MBY5984340.1 TRAP transporter small permease subunit [Halomonas sp. DP5Y7-2]MBY6234433.1 TRAP transporter small permease subunit [Halomonas sp. DP4Y7-1]
MTLIHAIERLTRWAGGLGALLTFPLIAALVYEVFSRYVLGQPTLWAFEVSYMVMGAIFMLGMADTLRQGQHVSVDLMTLRWSRRTNALVQLIGYAVFLPVLAWLVWELGQYAHEALLSNERSGRSAWNPVIWPVFLTWWLGFLLLALQVVAEVFKAIAAWKGQATESEGAQ